MLQINCSWKARLDNAPTWGASETIVGEALSTAERTDQLALMRDLYQEFIAPDQHGGGRDGSRALAQRIACHLGVEDRELLALGLDPRDFRACVFHA
jgi:hypothetical protein